MITSFYGLCLKVVTSGVDRGISTAHAASLPQVMSTDMIT